MDEEKSQKDITGVQNKTTIKLSRELRDKLAEIGNKDETFEDVIRRLIRRAESERSGEIVTSKSSVIQYKRRKEFIELPILHVGLKAGYEYEYNVPPKKEGEWDLDIKVLKVYYNLKTYNPSEFFGVDNETKYFSEKFIFVYFDILADILIKEFGITKLKDISVKLRDILEWRKIYYEHRLSQESFINDVEDVLRDFSEKKSDTQIQKQIGKSIAGQI